MQSKNSLREGTFCISRGRAFVDFMQKIGGCTSEEAKKMMEKGMNVKLEVCSVSHKKWRVIVTCKEFPEFNMIECVEDDKEMHMENALYGKAKVMVTMPAANMVKICTESEKMGKTEVMEVFTDDGMTATTKGRGGATLTEHWSRVCCEEGAYRYVCNENGESFAKATGALEGTGMTFEDTMKDASFMLKSLGNDSWQMTEHFMGQTNTLKIAMNEEVDYTFPGWERRMLCTRIAPNKLKCIMKHKDGRVEEWMRCQTADGNMVWHGKCIKTGKEVKIYYEKFTCLDGTWRPVSKEGVQRLTQYMGVPEQMARQMAADFETKTIIKSKAGGYYQMRNDSKEMPYNIIIKMDEEFEMSQPATDKPIKCIMAASGRDTYVMIRRHEKATVKISTKVTPNFMVLTEQVLGTNICAKIIMARCDM